MAVPLTMIVSSAIAGTYAPPACARVCMVLWWMHIDVLSAYATGEQPLDPIASTSTHTHTHTHTHMLSATRHETPPTCSARTHHACNLWNALCGHVGLVEEDPACERDDAIIVEFATTSAF